MGSNSVRYEQKMCYVVIASSGKCGDSRNGSISV
jgi:hypothetical protein